MISKDKKEDIHRYITKHLFDAIEKEYDLTKEEAGLEFNMVEVPHDNNNLLLRLLINKYEYGYAVSIGYNLIEKIEEVPGVKDLIIQQFLERMTPWKTIKEIGTNKGQALLHSKHDDLLVRSWCQRVIRKEV